MYASEKNYRCQFSGVQCSIPVSNFQGLSLAQYQTYVFLSFSPNEALSFGYNSVRGVFRNKLLVYTRSFGLKPTWKTESDIGNKLVVYTRFFGLKPTWKTESDIGNKLVVYTRFFGLKPTWKTESDIGNKLVVYTRFFGLKPTWKTESDIGNKLVVYTRFFGLKPTWETENDIGKMFLSIFLKYSRRGTRFIFSALSLYHAYISFVLT